MLARMEQASKVFGQLYRLTIQFTEMLRKRQVEQLRPLVATAVTAVVAVSVTIQTPYLVHVAYVNI